MYDPNQLYHCFKISHKTLYYKIQFLETGSFDKNRPGLEWNDSKQHVIAPNLQCQPLGNRNRY